MRLLFVADGRSPIALNWIQHFIEAGDEVHLVSTFPCTPGLKLASLAVLPVAFSGVKGRDLSQGDRAEGRRRGVSQILWGDELVQLRTRFRQWLGPMTLPAAARRLQEILARIQPDLVHAMRIPYEGMLAALAQPAAPLLISVWGNDFTLHAPANPWMRAYTHLALERAAGLHADCQRDVRLARAWGLPAGCPAVVLPGGGGVQIHTFFPPPVGIGRVSSPTVIQPRGVRAYVCNEAFFHAIPLILDRLPTARFLCPGMVGEERILRRVEKLGIGGSVELMPRQPRSEMAPLFRRAQVVVSPTTHDGTPNTLLEALACGCFPVAGDLESLREWITPGLNGLLVDPGNPQALAEAVLQAFDRPELRDGAESHNLRLIFERAEYGRVMRKAGTFYRQLAEGRQGEPLSLDAQ